MEIPRSKKYQDIVEAARQLFWKYGYRKVTVDEICVAAQVSRMTFYRFFPGKLDTAKAVLDQVMDKAVQEFRVNMESEKPVPEKISELIRMKFEGVHDISSEFMQDFYRNADLGLSDYMAKKAAQVWQEMIMDFQKAQAGGIIRKDLNLGFFFLISQKLIDLVRDEAFTSQFADPEEMIMEMANLFVYGIVPHE